jgi:hypothetical protein
VGDLFTDLPGVVVADDQLDAVVGGEKRSGSDDSSRKRRKPKRKRGPQETGKRRK